LGDGFCSDGFLLGMPFARAYARVPYESNVPMMHEIAGQIVDARAVSKEERKASLLRKNGVFYDVERTVR
jgi:hypothetical protein